MELRGEIKSLSSTFPERKIRLELETNGNLEDIEKLKGKDLTISLSRYRKKRSLDANAFLWKCLGDMAAVLGCTEEIRQVYLHQNHRNRIYKPSEGLERNKDSRRDYGEEPGDRRAMQVFRSPMLLRIQYLR